MLSRLIAALLFKAVLSLAALLGIASYAHHLSGGDPGALWQRVAGHALGGAARSIDGLGERIGAPVAALAAGVPGEGRAGLTNVWTWQDANGVTHYTDQPPAGTDAAVIGIDPDVNVLAPASAPAAPSVATPTLARSATGLADGGAHASRRVAGVEGEAGAPLPGIGGVLLRARGGSADADPGQAAALLRMLQGSSR